MSFQLGKFKDIPLTIHWSFTLLLVGIISVIGYTQGIKTGILYGLGIVALFASVILHEFMHSYIASRFGYDTDEIVLYPLGGMSKIQEMPSDPKEEFLIAFMGPVTNFIIAGLVYGIYIYLNPLGYILLGRDLGSLILYYAVLNVGLGIFNLFVPAIPMDGGRLLRAILASRMSYPQATRSAVRVSKIIAVILGLIGFIVDTWLLIIAIFVFIASSSELEESLTQYILEDISLNQVHTSDIVTIDASTNISSLLNKMLDLGHTGFLVKDNDDAVGVVTLSDVQQVDPQKRDDTSVRDIMTRSILTLRKGATAKEALALLKNRDIGRLFVEDEGSIIGVLTRSDLIKFVEIKSLQKAKPKEEQAIAANLDANYTPS